MTENVAACNEIKFQPATLLNLSTSCLCVPHCNKREISNRDGASTSVDSVGARRYQGWINESLSILKILSKMPLALYYWLCTRSVYLCTTIVPASITTEHCSNT